MAKNRKKAEKYILDWISKITNNDKFNVNLYKELFKNMSDKEFDNFMVKLRDNNDILNIIVPHDRNKVPITTKRMFKLAKELGFDMFQKYIIEIDGDKIKSKYPAYILTLPFRRTKQTIEKGISVADSDKKVDNITGQVASDSKSSKISYPELQLLVGMGLNESLVELMSDRGGDQSSYIALKKSLTRYGSASEDIIKNYREKTGSSKAVKSYFNGMHLKINV